MKTRHTIDPEELGRLRKGIEHRLTFPIKGPDDYSRLSDLLKDEGCGTVSATTLKRIWGYISDTGSDYRPNAYTVTALCRFIGFKDLEEFRNSDFPIQSKEYTGKFVESCNLPEDSKVEIRWQPNRTCRLRHINATLFSVENVENSSSLRVGDLVECVCLTQHAPAFFRIFRGRQLPVMYVAGSASGIYFDIIDEAASPHTRSY